MIICRLSGGLGNQFFQYATARRLALKHNAELVLDLNWFSHVPRDATTRVYELWRYPVAARIATESESRLLRRYSTPFLRRLPFNKPWRTYFEKGLEFNSKVLNLPDNTYLHGYWQSHKYFHDIEQCLNKELRPRDAFGLLDIAVADLIRTTHSVSVHVRRSDYVTHEAAANYHGICSIDYYQSAFKRISDQISEPHFFVFSDDMKWVKENIVFPGEVTFVEHNTADTAYQDLRLMSLCKHKIIANSSFSWWAAWLKEDATYSNSTVIVPKTWFLRNKVATQDRFPVLWQLI